jgi:hypothetical protein
MIPALWIASLWIWQQIFALLLLTFFTFFLQGPSTHFQEVSDTILNYQMIAQAGAWLIFALMAQQWGLCEQSEFGDFQKIRSRFLPAFLRGATAASALLAAFWSAGYLDVLGILSGADEGPNLIWSVLIRVIALAVFCWLDEWFWRQQIQSKIPTSWTPQLNTPLRPESKWLTWIESPKTLAALALIALGSTAIKSIGFELSWSQKLTVFLLSLFLSLRYRRVGEWGSGAGLVAGFLILLHPVAGLPIFGIEVSGLFMARYQAYEGFETWSRLFSGGSGGPLASAALQLLLATEIVRRILKIQFRRSRP